MATISDQERAAIDAAISAGKVQKIPAGKSVYQDAYDYVWDGSINKLVNKVPACDVPGTREHGAKKLKERRAVVAELLAERKTAAEIAKITKASIYTIRNDIKHLKDKTDAKPLSLPSS